MKRLSFEPPMTPLTAIQSDEGNVGATRRVAPTKPFSWRTWRLGGSILVLLFVFAFPAFAQEALDDGVVTADEVNIVAQRLYCPVCPNERLDACQTAACASWRDDIRRQLEAGQTEEEIVADFVRRYGERAAGTPLDPTLRALSIYTPYIFALIVLVIGVITFLRWRGQRSIAKLSTEGGVSPPSDTPDDDYRRILERDLSDR